MSNASLLLIDLLRSVIEEAWVWSLTHELRQFLGPYAIKQYSDQLDDIQILCRGSPATKRCDEVLSSWKTAKSMLLQ